MTQAVGYCRVMENINLGLIYAHKHNGWESVLGIFRSDRDRWHERAKSNGNVKPQSAPSRSVPFNLEHPFWQLSYFTFFGLCVVCTYVSTSFFYKFGASWEWLLWAFSLAILLLSYYINRKTIQSLINGNDSIEHYETIWKLILEIRGPQREGGDRRISISQNYNGLERRSQKERRAA